MTAPASAQSTASITGTVRDSSNAVLPGVTGTAVQTETGLVRSVVSDESGGYVLASLPVWPYRLEFSLTGFRTAVQTGIVLQVNTNPTIDATLPLGDLTETIQVAAGAPLIDTRSPGIGMVVDNERVEELPLNGRLTLDLVYLPGLAAPSGTLSGARGGAAGPGSPGTIAVAGGLPTAPSTSSTAATTTTPTTTVRCRSRFPRRCRNSKWKPVRSRRSTGTTPRPSSMRSPDRGRTRFTAARSNFSVTTR